MGKVWARREEGGGFRMGNTCIPVVDYVKFKNKIKFKIFKKKKVTRGKKK